MTKRIFWTLFLISTVILAAACQPTLEPEAGSVVSQSATPTPEPSDDEESDSGSEDEEENEEEDSSPADEDSDIEFQNADEGGPVVITGNVTYTNPFFTSGTAQPLILLEDQTGFVNRDTNYIFPLESQVLGQITSNFFESPFTYSMVLPIEPQGGQSDVDNDGEEEVGVQVFAVAYWDNTYGGPFLEERDLGGGGWSTAYVSTEISSDLETEREIIGGKLIVYAPDDQQSFPINFGDDGLLFSEDDQDMVDLPQGYTVVDLNTIPFTFDRARRQQIDLIEPEGAALIDLSDQPFTEAFDNMIAELKEKYAFSDVKGVDWDELSETYRPRIEAAEEDDDPLEFRRAVRDLLWNVPDGHVSGPVVIEDFREAVNGGVGLGIRDVDDGRVIVNYLLEGGPAAEAGISLGNEILEINGEPIDEWVDSAIAYSAPFSTDHVERLQKLRYAVRFPAGSTVEITYINEEGDEETIEIDTVQEFASFNQSSFFTDRTGFELPVEWELLDDGYVLVRITGFLDNQLLTIQLWERLMENLNQNDVPGIVIDMRHNSGGFGFTADQMAAYFFDEEFVTGNTEKYDEDAGEFIIKEEDADRFILPDPSLRYDGEIVVMVGPACASACEFFSYNMTIDNRATIVGQYPTAGLGGSVKELRLPAGEQIRYTVGRAVDADGNIHIEGIGVVPDIVVPVTEETLFSDGDPVLEAALNVLNGEFTFAPAVEAEIEVGESVEGSVGEGDSLFYSAELTEGQVLNIFLNSDDQDEYDPFIRLYGEDGTLLLENDDLGTKSLNAGFEDLDVPFDVILYIEVTSFEGGSGGDFTLIIEEVEQ